MEEGDSLVRRWGGQDKDTLVKILQSFDLFELSGGVAHVCSAWRLACSDQLLWKTLDLSVLKSNFIKMPLVPYVYVDSESDKTLTRLLKICLKFSRGNILTLIFHYNLYVSNDQLTYTAERCPRLKRLVMPSWNIIERTGICTAIHMWEDLESLTMTSIANPLFVIEEIAWNCKSFAELKIMGPCDMQFAYVLVSFLPNLKVLSVRCTVLSRNVLVAILDGLKKLAVLNISHCIITEDSPSAPKKILAKIDESILEKASKLRNFLTCMSDSCIMCQRTRNDEGLMRWSKYEEDFWKVDESYQQNHISHTQRTQQIHIYSRPDLRKEKEGVPLSISQIAAACSTFLCQESLQALFSSVSNKNQYQRRGNHLVVRAENDYYAALVYLEMLANQILRVELRR